MEIAQCNQLGWLVANRGRVPDIRQRSDPAAAHFLNSTVRSCGCKETLYWRGPPNETAVCAKPDYASAVASFRDADGKADPAL